MFHSRSLNNKINWLHERCLRIIYNDERSTFEELLAKDNSVSVQHNNIHVIANEMYKVVNGISPEIINKVFKLRKETYHHVGHTAQFLVDPIHSVFNGSENQLHIWVLKFGNKYLLKLKINTLSWGLKKKLRKRNH